jgi:hypothetical protein
MPFVLNNQELEHRRGISVQFMMAMFAGEIDADAVPASAWVVAHVFVHLDRSANDGRMRASLFVFLTRENFDALMVRVFIFADWAQHRMDLHRLAIFAHLNKFHRPSSRLFVVFALVALVKICTINALRDIPLMSAWVLSASSNSGEHRMPVLTMVLGSLSFRRGIGSPFYVDLHCSMV